MRETDREKSSLGTHILLIGLGALFFIVIVAGLNIWQDYRNTQSWALRHAQTMSQNLAEHAARSLDAVDLTLLTVKKQAERDRVSEPRSSEEIIGEFEEYIAALPQIRGLILTDRAGIIRYTERKKSIGMDIHDRGYFKYHQNSTDSELYVGKPLVGRTTGRWFFSTSRKIEQPDGSFDGISMALVTQGYFKNFYDRVEAEENISAAYVTLDGMIFAASRNFSKEFEDVAGKNIDFVDRGKFKSERTDRFVGKLFPGGVERVVSYARVSGYPIYLVTSIEHDVAMDSWNQRTKLVGFLVLSACIILFGLISAANRHYKRREIAEAELRESERRFRDIAESTSDWFWEMDESLQFTYLSPRFFELSGFQPKDVIGKKRSDFQSEETLYDDWASHLADMDERVPFTDFQYELVCKNGERISISVSGQPIFSEGKKFLGYRGAARDITQRKHDEKALLEQEGRYHSIITTSHDGFWLVDVEGKILDVNDAYCERSGYSRRELLSMRLSDLDIHMSDEEVASKIRSGIKAGSGLFTTEHRTKEGETWPVEISSSYDRTGGGRFFSFIRDISERERLEQQLRRAQKMEAVGQLTGGIAHDFNNILGIVLGNLQILQRVISGDEKAVGRIDIAIKSVMRGAELTRKLLGFSRQEAHGSKLTSVNEFIENLEELLSKSLTVAINLEHHLSPDSWLVEVDPGDLQDAILNLALNARDSMPEGGNLVIETANKVLGEDYVRQNPQGEEGEYVMISVSDTGKGMSAEIRERVFEPFFTTKEEGKGTGLGLSMVYGFVKRSGGHINIYSEMGEGTTISLYIPRAQKESNGVAGQIEDIELPSGDETILVVDDEDHLIDIAVIQLQDLGYKTDVANNAKQALEKIRENRNIDLLFSDVIMPGGMDGYELAVEAKNENPDLNVLLTSGFTKKREKMGLENNALYTELAANLLSKPYSQAELATVVRRILDGDKYTVG